MDLYELIEEILKNINYIKQLEINLDTLRNDGDIKSIINDKKESRFIKGFLNPYLNTFRYKQAYNELTKNIELGLKYNDFSGYDFMEKHFIKNYVRNTPNEIVIERLMDYDQLLLLNKATIRYIKKLNSEITTTLEIQSETYNY